MVGRPIILLKQQQPDRRTGGQRHYHWCSGCFLGFRDDSLRLRSGITGTNGHIREDFWEKLGSIHGVDFHRAIPLLLHTFLHPDH